MSSDLLYQRWKSGYAALSADLSRFRDRFAGIKKCGCDICDCRHYRRARHVAFGERIQRLFDLKLQSAARLHLEAGCSDYVRHVQE